MKYQKISILLGMIILVGCSGRGKDPTPTIAASCTLPSLPKPTNTIQPTLIIPTPAKVVTRTPDACSKQTMETLTTRPDLNARTLIAFTSASKDNGDEVFIMDLDGQGLKDITNHPASDRSPVWSPDGKHIAFLSNRNGPITISCNGASSECIYELFVVNPDGTDLRQITKGWTSSPVWSPDGQQMAFLRSFESDASPNPSDLFLYDLYVVNSDGTNLRNLTDSPGYYYEPMWSHSGKKIAFRSSETAANSGTINIINSDRTGELLAYSDLRAYETTWSLDDNYLIFISQPDSYRFGNDIYRLELDSNSVEQLTFTPDAKKSNIALSPDGRWLAYHSQTQALCNQIRVLNIETLEDWFVYDLRDVDSVEVDANSVQPLYSPLGIYGIAWSPDSRQIIFTQLVRFERIFGEFDWMFKVHLDGSGLSQLGAGQVSLFSVQP